MSESAELPALPTKLRWLNQPQHWERLGDDALLMHAGAGTDLFNDPGGEAWFDNAPALIGQVDGDFMLSARVGGELVATYDAAVLLLYADDRHWAKLCLEVSPQGVPTIVSVVTRGVSDDCNSFAADAGRVELRVCRLGPAYAFHARTDAGAWQLIRYFALDGDPAVGFLAQSPTGNGCTVRFEGISYAATRLTDLRGGT